MSNEIKDKDIEKTAKLYEKELGAFMRHLSELQAGGKKAITHARMIYKLTDKKLKDKSLTPSQKKEPLDLRKNAYDFTTEVKTLNLL